MNRHRLKNLLFNRFLFMKINFLAVSFCLLNSLFIFAQEAFTVHVLPSAITSVPATHSGAFASYNGKWIFIGGRIDGLHIMQSGQAFPTFGRNDSIFIVDPAANTYTAVTAKTLPGYTYEALCSSNMEYYQDGQYLYMIGGYGSEDSSTNWITFPTLISVDLNCLLTAVSSSSPISGCFRLLIDSNLAVTGGGLEKLDSTYYLVFGHRFDGRYSSPPSSLFTQQYTHEIRKFGIVDNGISLSLNNYTVVNDTDLFHRRDFNLVPQIYPNADKGFTVFGGVCQKNIDRPFLTPIDISAAGIQHQSTFNENLNQYTTAALPVYDSLHNFMHTVFFGGISLYQWDTVSMALVEDTLVPFVSTISKVTRDSSGNLTESLIQESMPALKGSNAIFIPDPSVMSYEGRIINLNALSGNTLVGFIAGGIHSDFPNVANLDPVGMSRPNPVLYEVYIDKTVNAIPELQVKSEINNLLVFPNPVRNRFEVSFSSSREAQCDIKLYDTQGKLIRTLLKDKTISGNQSFTFSFEGLSSGVYTCRVSLGNSSKALILKIEN
jgi:Secretion system C-terminal sorting domain